MQTALSVNMQLVSKAYCLQGKWKHLPYTYNAQKRIKYHHPTLWRMEDIHIVHIVDEKPWDHRWVGW